MEYNYFYRITNTVNGKFYYGVHKTKNLDDNYLGSGVAIGRAKKKYGKENFFKEILIFFKTYEECLKYEALIVNKDMLKNPMCYNMKFGGKGGGGFTHSVEIRAKISDAGRNISDKTRAKLSGALMGHAVSDEARAKIGAAHKGKIISEETRLKLSDAGKGKKQSDETKAKRSASIKATNYLKKQYALKNCA